MPFSGSLSFISTGPYPPSASIMKNAVSSLNEPIHSSMCEMGSELLFVTAFRSDSLHKSKLWNILCRQRLWVLIIPFWQFSRLLCWLFIYVGFFELPRVRSFPLRRRMNWLDVVMWILMRCSTTLIWLKGPPHTDKILTTCPQTCLSIESSFLQVSLQLASLVHSARILHWE